MKQAAVNAPELSTRSGWVNTEKSFSLQDFRGKIILLDFWTYGCINCQHIIPDLRRLEEEYPDELVIIGVHSAKFNTEKDTLKIREAILKFGINHPVINDADYLLWDAYAVRAWPTVVLISPAGKVIGQHAGEGVYQVVKPYLDTILKEYAGSIKSTKLTFQYKTDQKNKSLLRFPSKLISGSGNTLWCADSGNNRILQLSASGKILTVIGSGTQELKDGNFSEAGFYEPHGLALLDKWLYIADTKNNAVRLADLEKRTVSTLAGTGKLDYYFFDDRWDEPVLPNSPWDLLIYDNALFVASAGNHQILRMDLQEKTVRRFAGTGREALANGSLREAAFNQPSGLTRIGNTLYVSDAEASAIRAVDLTGGIVYTPLGRGLFDFGDADGAVEDALLQHNMGITAHNDNIYIADTYNGKIKEFDLRKERIKTILAGLNEPNDVLFMNNRLWISDTNNHQLVSVRLQTMSKAILKVES